MLNQKYLIKLAALNCPNRLVRPEEATDWDEEEFTFYSDQNRLVSEQEMLSVKGQECLIWINDNPDILNGGKGLTAIGLIEEVNTELKTFKLKRVSLLQINLGSTFLAEFSHESSIIEYIHKHRRKCIHQLDEEALETINNEIKRRKDATESGKIIYEATADSSELTERAKKLEGRISIKYPPSGSLSPKTSDRFVSKYIRLPEVVAFTKFRANGICQLCQKHAPFYSKHTPFLEVHHVKTLAEGGSDKITNTVAICPNCHRALHYSDKKLELLESLYEKNEFLVRE